MHNMQARQQAAKPQPTPCPSGCAYRVASSEPPGICAVRRPLFLQFCGNDADTVLKAARHVEDQVDAVDLNFGCPQRIAKRGRYGAFLMDDLDLVSGLLNE